MLDAIRQLADSRPEERQERLAVFHYLNACSLLFQNGILSHESADKCTSRALQNIRNGYNFFKVWKDSIPKGTIISLY